MNALRGAAAMLAAAVVLAGCAGQPEIPYDRAAKAQIKKIGIVTPAFAEPSVILLNSVGSNFGLIGALADAGVQSNRDSKLKAMLQQQKYSPQDYFIEHVTKDLRAAGYTVVMVPVKRDGSDFVEKYPSGDGQAVDAYLDLVAPVYGYIANGTGDSTPYRPRVVVKARLVSAKDSSVLMQDRVLYNPLGPDSTAVTIPADPALQFKDFDALAASPQTAVRGLRVATEQSAQTVAKLLQ
jgi:hypothetical protein